MSRTVAATVCATMFTIAMASAAAVAAPQTAPATAAPAAALTPAAAAAFMGDWAVAGESQMGPFVVNVSVKEEAKAVVGEISSEIQAPTKVTDVTKNGDSLVLRYSFDYEGNAIPAVLTLTPKADKLDAYFSFADGAFEMGGVGTKAAPAAAQ